MFLLDGIVTIKTAYSMNNIIFYLSPPYLSIYSI